jgi:hypothetical protein
LQVWILALIRLRWYQLIHIPFGHCEVMIITPLNGLVGCFSVRW